MSAGPTSSSTTYLLEPPPLAVPSSANVDPVKAGPHLQMFSPSECQDALTHDNPTYWALRLTRLPSWVKCPNSYAASSSSSLVVSFEDPTGDTLQTLLAQKCLFAFGQASDLQVWKQKPRAHASPPPPDEPHARLPLCPPHSLAPYLTPPCPFTQAN
ncbi:hypothetical protein EDB86DRAFT_3176359 [Lactarius hatsudake]|nr:hypothetical protein EDB86DRAFT_3176359 [Lactarius hatsudake]